MQRPINKFINLPQNAVKECIQGIVITNPELGIIQNTQVVALKSLKQKVHLIGGGGSGHEPADAGFLYQNGLSAAVCGGCFSSPSSQQVLSAIEYVDKQQGVLLIIKNYTGDIINFELAKQSAELRKIHVESLTVRDDIAFIDEDPKRENARGLSGLIIVYQILGNAANQGINLKDLVNLGNSIGHRLFTLNVALGPCSLPGNSAGFSIENDKFELGLGIHGEKGKQTIEWKSINQIVELLKVRFQKVVKSKNIVVMLNNLGGCSEMQISIIILSITKSFSNYNILRIIEGRVLTSFQMHGFSLTIFEEPSAAELRYLDVFNPQWKIHNKLNHNSIIPFQKDHVRCLDENKTYQLTPQAVKIKQLMTKIAQKREYFDSVDRQVGDGDTGTSINRALKFILQNDIIQKLDWKQKFNLSLKEIGRLIATKSAGTLGSILGAFVMSVSIELKPRQQDNDYETWKSGFQRGISTIKIVGKCEEGERTILDVLVPVVNILATSEAFDFVKMKEVADAASEKVKSLKASKGRSRYLGGKEVGHPDSGCELIKEVIVLLKDLNAS